MNGRDLTDYVRQLEQEIKTVRRDNLRRLRDISETECQVCKRKIKVGRGPWGTTLVVCPHILAALRKHAQSSAVEQDRPCGTFPSTIYGFVIELADITEAPCTDAGKDEVEG